MERKDTGIWSGRLGWQENYSWHFLRRGSLLSDVYVVGRERYLWVGIYATQNSAVELGGYTSERV